VRCSVLQLLNIPVANTHHPKHHVVCVCVLQCVAVRCSALQCVAVFAVRCSVLQCVAVFAVCCCLLQCVAVRCSVLQLLNISVANTLHPKHHAVCGYALQCVAVCGRYRIYH